MYCIRLQQFYMLCWFSTPVASFEKYFSQSYPTGLQMHHLMHTCFQDKFCFPVFIFSGWQQRCQKRPSKRTNTSCFGCATEGGRLGSITGRVIPKTWKTVLVACPASCSALMGGCKRTVYARCCHWLATSVAFTAKATAWSTGYASGNGRRRPLVTLRKE